MKYAVDTNILIYILEANPEFGAAALQLMELLESRGDDLCVSTLVFAEVSAYPGMTDQQAAATCEAVHQMELAMQPLDEQILRLAGKLRRDHRLKLADAIHIASALAAKADYFVTNDVKLSKKAIAEIKFMNLEYKRLDEY